MSVDTLLLTKNLNENERLTFQIEYDSAQKEPTTALLLCLFLGGFGAHRFYLGETKPGVFYALFCWTLIPALISLFELFTISKKVRKKNQSLAQEVASKIKMMRD